MPQAIGLGLAVIISLYLLLNLTYVRVLGFDALASADSIAAQVAAAAFGEAAGVALSLLLFLAVLGFVNVAMLTNPRLLLAMSEDAALPAGLARVSARTGAPTAALTLFVAVALASLFAAGTFDVILNYTMFLDSIGMAAGAAALFVLRRQTSHLDDLAIYRMRLYPALPLLFIAAYLFIAFAVASADPQAAVRGAGIFAAFAVVDLVARRRRRSPSARPPEP